MPIWNFESFWVDHPYVVMKVINTLQKQTLWERQIHIINSSNMKEYLQKDYHNGSQNQNPPFTTADLKHKLSCSYLKSVYPLYS